MVMVTHDAKAATIADRVLFLADGQIVRDLGRADEEQHHGDGQGSHPDVIRVALRGLAGRKLRAFLTALAIVLGVAMVSGTFVLTDMIDRAFNDIFTQSYANTDAYISGKSPGFDFKRRPGGAAVGPGEPAADGAQASRMSRRPPGPSPTTSATKIIDRKGKPITTSGAPTFGFGLDYSLPQFNPLQADVRALAEQAATRW